MSFLDTMIKKAKSDLKTIILPETTDLRIIAAAADVIEKKIANIVLIGHKAQIEKDADDNSLDISNATIIEIDKFEKMDSFIDKLVELRKHKGMTVEKATVSLLNPLVFGIMMVKMKMADGMVAGAINSTANTLRPALQILRTAPGTKLVSSFFIMCVPNCEYGDNGTFAFGDCGLIEEPDAEQLSEIAISTAGSFKSLLGTEPVVGMLSYSTYGSAQSASTDKVVEALKLAQGKAPKLAIDGEFQLDAAIIESVGKKKAPGSKYAGKANVLIFPDLNSGNIGYKLTQRLANAEAYGPLLQGIASPVNDLSRGCTAEDITGVVAITAVQAQNMEK
ncbi:MAG: phosphate acetyltransferase [Clostridiales bacterium]|nr:phosphate acetyltransferase [Clostridiales bacterium]